MKTKGIILAGGTGSRLFPSTVVCNKQLLSVYDKPMIYYPLSSLISSGIKEICIICRECDHDQYKRLLGDGKDLGISINYLIQDKPNGIAQAFIIAQDFIGNNNVTLILGDNIFIIPNNIGYLALVQEALENNCSFIPLTTVKDPTRYGVPIINENGKIVSIVEKPEKADDNFIIPGWYWYTNDVVEKAKNLKPSERGELEITDINNLYINEKRLEYNTLNNCVWFDSGTVDDLNGAANFIKAYQDRTGNLIGSPEGSSLLAGNISIGQFLELVQKMPNVEYKQYLERYVY